MNTPVRAIDPKDYTAPELNLDLYKQAEDELLEWLKTYIAALGWAEIYWMVTCRARDLQLQTMEYNRSNMKEQKDDSSNSPI
jgi:hypothetical protein